MSGDLEGRAAVVTGAARGIGYAVAFAFAREGARVVVADLDGDGARRAAKEIAERTGARITGIAVDVADPDAVLNAVGLAEEAVGVCSIVVANAGILVLKPALEISAAEFERSNRINLDGAFHTLSAFGRRLVDAGLPGSLLVTSSLFGLRSGAGNAAYASGKFGLIGLVQSMAADLAPAGVRVNAVCPGQIGSDMLDALFVTRAEGRGTTPDEERARFCARIPMGRLGTVDEVADTFVFLASDRARYTTGQALVVDGGWQVS